MTVHSARILRADAVMAVSILLLGSFLCFTGMGVGGPVAPVRSPAASARRR